MFINGTGTALPPHHFTQSECWAQLKDAPAAAQLSSRSRALLQRVLTGNNGIHTRHIVTPSVAEGCTPDLDVLQDRFARNAPVLGAQAGERALKSAGTAPMEIDALIVSSCTGYLCPGLSSYIAERLGLRSDILALDLVGQGCGAALPNLRTAEALIAARRARRVLSVCVEVCSAAYYLDDDPGVLISACLFGDGAGAALVGSEPAPHSRRVEWLDSESHLNPAARDLLRFEHRQGFLRNVLTPQVPELAARAAEEVFSRVAARAEIKHKEIAGWLFHAGGRDVLRALQARLSLSDEDLRWSSAVLRDIGNVSSPFIYFVLEAALRGDARGGRWWMSSFGAGFSAHGALLDVA